MTETKFRVWDVTAKKMIYISEIEDYPLGYITKGNTDYAKFMQFVGLWDDDGIEIYEGDIVEIQNTYETKTSYKSQVYFNYDGALVKGHPTHIKLGHKQARRLSEFCDYGVGGMYHARCKIVGNIYEDAELLEEC